MAEEIEDEEEEEEIEEAEVVEEVVEEARVAALAILQQIRDVEAPSLLALATLGAQLLDNQLLAPPSPPPPPPSSPSALALPSSPICMHRHAAVVVLLWIGMLTPAGIVGNNEFLSQYRLHISPRPLKLRLQGTHLFTLLPPLPPCPLPLPPLPLPLFPPARRPYKGS